MGNKVKFFNNQYSWILVPLSVVLFIFYPNLRIVLQPALYSIAIVGWIINFIEPKYLWGYILAFVGHLPCFIFLLWGYKYFILNFNVWLISVFGLFFLSIMPNWPYKLSRSTVLIIYSFTILSYYALCFILQNK